MQKKRSLSVILGTVVLTTSLFIHALPVLAEEKAPSTVDPIGILGENAKILGLLNVNFAGFGTITDSAVKELQKKYMPEAVILAENTANKLAGNLPKTVASRGDERQGYLVPWFGDAENIFARGDTATVYDIETGLSFNIKRTYGTNHADCETLTKEDTEIMKKIYGGSWSWNRRAIIVTVNGRKLAASMAGMPHAGVDSKPANVIVNDRSEGYGRGENLDTVKNNGMNGHFDIHFLNSKTHGTNRVDENHQAMVKKAADWAMENLQ